MPTRMLLAISVLTLQGCTIAYYDLKNELDSSSIRRASCDVKYSIKFVSGSYTNSFGAHDDKNERLQKERGKYVSDTREILSGSGCKATYVEEEDGATLEIRIDHLAQLSALPQEWLTGLSFGLIPSWGTRNSEYTYSFKDIPTGKSHVYTVDTKTYNHLILFPVFWINFFTLNESRVYKNALTNFLDKS